MTFFATGFGMCPLQFEVGKVVVELGWFPSIHRMAGCAIPSKSTLMGIVIVVAGIAILQRCLKIADRARIEMTFRTVEPVMFAGDLELEPVVIEIRHQAVHTVMTIQAG